MNSRQFLAEIRARENSNALSDALGRVFAYGTASKAGSPAVQEAILRLEDRFTVATSAAVTANSLSTEIDAVVNHREASDCSPGLSLALRNLREVVATQAEPATVEALDSFVKEGQTLVERAMTSGELAAPLASAVVRLQAALGELSAALSTVRDS